MMRKTKAYRPAAAEALEDRAVPTTGIASLPSVDAQKVMDAFRAFETTYYQDVQTILMAPGTTSPSANRAAFDSAISSAANNLNTSIDKTIATLPSASTLQSTIQNQVAGASQSMVTQLQAIPTPKEVASGALKAFSQLVRDRWGRQQTQVVFGRGIVVCIRGIGPVLGGAFSVVVPTSPDHMPTQLLFEPALTGKWHPFGDGLAEVVERERPDHVFERSL